MDKKNSEESIPEGKVLVQVMVSQLMTEGGKKLKGETLLLSPDEVKKRGTSVRELPMASKNIAIEDQLKATIIERDAAKVYATRIEGTVEELKKECGDLKSQLEKAQEDLIVANETLKTEREKFAAFKNGLKVPPKVVPKGK